MKRTLIPLELEPLAARPPGDRLRSLEGATMGTTWRVTLAGALPLPLAALRGGIEATLARVVAQMSSWDEASDLSRFNRAPPGTWQDLPADFAAVLDCALTLAADSGGAYDPAAGALVDLWGFGPPGGGGTPPSGPALAAARAAGGWRQIVFDRAGGRAQRRSAARLDLSAVAKGFGVDAVADELEGLGLASYLVEVGGELRGRGVKPDGSPWWVALERPPGAAAAAFPGELVVALHGLAIATSGDYRRCFEAGGRRYSHLIDPRDGRPLDGRLASVTVLHRRCMEADALATALAVLGPEAGLAYGRQRGIAALFLRRGARGLEEIMTPAFAAMLD